MSSNTTSNSQNIPSETYTKDSTTASLASISTTTKQGTTSSPDNTVASASTATNNTVTATATVAAAAAAKVVLEDNENTETDEDVIKNQKLVEEFQYLLEKSQSLFSGLRDLPNTGSHRQWRPYFEKTFEVYTKLWKFQQTHRSILEHKSNYGLKRWEVGEIASKIGQLYYHYYLRTSETNYLYEAYVFYEAIHDRQYFKDILEVKNSALMIKKMRYYARFIIVCLLLNKDENVRQLISELEGLIEEYAKSFKPPDAKEWQMVLEEINTFTEAEKKLVPINLDRTPDKIEHRLSAHIPERNNTHKLKLQEAILVGNYQKQIKFSELTLDMYRMLQSLEREPFILHPSTTKKPNESNTTATTATASTTAPGTLAAATSTTTSTTAESSTTTTTNNNTSSTTKEDPNKSTNTTTTTITGLDKKSNIKKSNPHKYLLYRPSLSQLMVYISTAFKDTSEGSALLLYLSADGCAYPDQTVPGYGGGVVTNQRNKLASHPDRATSTNAASMYHNNTTNNTSTLSVNAVPTTTASTTATTTNANNASNSTLATLNPIATSTSTEASVPSVHCLHPADLIPFTRKPLFLIVDSNNSTEFRNMPNVFDQPVMCLMSPVEYPSSVQDKSEIGSLFTLFLHTPLLGFCSVSDIGNLDQQKWDACVQKIGMMEKAIGDLLMMDATVDKNVKRFMSDDFLYYFIVRFVLCGIFLRYHSSFKDEKTFPSSFPVLPESVYVSTEIVTMLGDLTNIADVGTYFSLPSYATGITTVPPPASVAVPSTNSPITTNQIATSPTSTMTVPPSTNASTTTTNTTTNPTTTAAATTTAVTTANTNPSTTTTTTETA